jgi:hypothetical protein
MLADFNYQTDQVQGYEQIYWGPNYNRLQQVGAALSHSTARSASKLLLLLLLMLTELSTVRLGCCCCCAEFGVVCCPPGLPVSQFVAILLLNGKALLAWHHSNKARFWVPSGEELLTQNWATPGMQVTMLRSTPDCLPHVLICCLCRSSPSGTLRVCSPSHSQCSQQQRLGEVNEALWRVSCSCAMTKRWQRRLSRGCCSVGSAASSKANPLI